MKTNPQNTEPMPSFSSEIYTDLFNRINSPLFFCELGTGRIREVNKAAFDLYGYSRSEFIEHSLNDLQFILNSNHTHTDSKLSTGKTEQTHFTKSGKKIFVELSVDSINSDQNESFLLCLINDITERKIKENKLRTSAAIVESSEDAIISKTIDGVITSWNKGAEKMYLYSGEEILGKSIEIIFPPDRKNEFSEIIMELKNGKKIDHFRTKRIKKDGSEISVSVTISPIYNSSGQIIGASSIARDITAQVTLENELFEKEERIKLAMAAGKMGTWEWNLNTNTISWDEYVHSLFGLKKGEFSGKYDDFLKLVYPEDRDIVNSAIESAVDSDKLFDAEYRIIWPDNSLHSILARGKVYKDNLNKPYKFIGVGLDISEKKNIELEKINLLREVTQLNQQLEDKVQKRTAELEFLNRELESFSYSVSHDLRAPLRAIQGFSNILIEDFGNKIDDEGKRILNVITSNTNKMGQLIDELLAFSRMTRTQLSYSEINFNLMVNNIIKEMEVPEDKINFNISKLPVAFGDETMLHQVWTNLISNAVKFSSKKETAQIEIGSTENNGTVYFIKDNGAGFEMKYYDKLFGVFQRLHKDAEFEGTGVGLALVNKIIVRHMGKIWAESKLNNGTTFYFTLGVKNENFK